MFRPQVGTPSSRATTAGAGLGSMPCAVLTMPSPVATGLARISSIAEYLERRRRSDHVDDGVVAADLMEVDLVHRPAVQSGLDLGKRGEGGQCSTGHPIGQPSLFHQPHDVRVGADHHVVV